MLASFFCSLSLKRMKFSRISLFMHVIIFELCMDPLDEIAAVGRKHLKNVHFLTVRKFSRIWNELWEVIDLDVSRLHAFAETFWVALLRNRSQHFAIVTNSLWKICRLYDRRDIFCSSKFSAVHTKLFSLLIYCTNEFKKYFFFQI
jgi:hypothetical protein